MSDGVVSDRFQTRGGNELSSHGTNDYLGERTVSSLNSPGSRYVDVIRRWYAGRVYLYARLQDAFKSRRYLQRDAA
jgi:hypothetical protein